MKEIRIGYEEGLVEKKLYFKENCKEFCWNSNRYGKWFNPVKIR